MKSIILAIVTLCVGIVVGLPVKDNEMDELVLRVNELRRMNPYQDGNRNIYFARNLDSIGGGNLLRSVNTMFDDEIEQPYLTTSNLEPFGHGDILIKGTSGINLNEYGYGQRQNLYNDKYHKKLQSTIDTLTPRLIRSLDSIGGGNLVRALDSIGGGGHLVKRTLDSIGGANLLKK